MDEDTNKEMEKLLDMLSQQLDKEGCCESIIVAIKPNTAGDGREFSLAVDAGRDSLSDAIGMLIELLNSQEFNNGGPKTIQ